MVALLDLNFKFFNEHCQMEWEEERLRICALILDGNFNFETLALELFKLQYKWNPIYQDYVTMIGRSPEEVDSISQIPFLPIQFFKSHEIKNGIFKAEKTFTSSGTSGQERSRHSIRDLSWYRKISALCFNHSFKLNPLLELKHLAMLPSYQENSDSSLLYMMTQFIHHAGGGFFHQDPIGLAEALGTYDDTRPIVLWGVSYALYQSPFFHLRNGLTVIETGGMKGKEREMTREELHLKIRENFGVTEVASEYGMTELISQAYAPSGGVFYPSPTLRIIPRCITDPFLIESFGQTGAINVIDLGNIDSCAFIATDDIGKVYTNGSFEVLGRLDHSDIRGCNMLIS